MSESENESLRAISGAAKYVFVCYFSYEIPTISGIGSILNRIVTASFNYPITVKGFDYWTGDEEAQKAVVDGDDMSATVTDFTYDTSYTYRAYAVIGSGISAYGEEVTFTTAVPGGDQQCLRRRCEHRGHLLRMRAATQLTA